MRESFVMNRTKKVEEALFTETISNSLKHSQNDFFLVLNGACHLRNENLGKLKTNLSSGDLKNILGSTLLRGSFFGESYILK